jgi:Ca2+-binding EF-hand superfamily protein
MFNDLMDNIEWFFNIHDKNKDGYLTKDEVLTLSESLLVRSADRHLQTHSHRIFF